MNKLFCWLGFHIWTAPLSDFIDEFGSIPLHGSKQWPSSAKCKHCGKDYK